MSDNNNQTHHPSASGRPAPPRQSDVRLSPDQTDPGHGSPIITGHRERTDPRAALTDTDPTPLASPVMLVTRAGDRYRLVAGNTSDGILVPLSSSAPLGAHTRLSLSVDEPGLQTVQVVLQVLGPANSAYGTGAAHVRWLAITASERRGYLVEALQRMLGVRAKVCVRDDVLGPHRRLVYNPSRMQVSLVNVGSEALPRHGRERTPTSRLLSAITPPPMASIEDVVGPAPRREKRGTRPFVLVDNGRMNEIGRTLMDTGRYGAVKPPAAAEPATSTVVMPTSPAVPVGDDRVPTGEMPAPGPVVRRSRGRGCYTMGGQLRGMNCAWIGRTHMAFETMVNSARDLHEGDVLSVGVPGSPLSSQVVWVVGEVSRMEEISGNRMVVEVDLRRSRRLPEVYASLVEYWEAQADASSE